MKHHQKHQSIKKADKDKKDKFLFEMEKKLGHEAKVKVNLNDVNRQRIDRNKNVKEKHEKIDHS